MKKYEISYVDEFDNDSVQIDGLVAVHGPYLLLPLKYFEIISSENINHSTDFISYLMINSDFVSKLGWSNEQAKNVVDKLVQMLDIPKPPPLRSRGVM